MVRRISILFLCLVAGLSGCKKDSPAGYPTVQITVPYALTTYGVPCTIQVSGHASDSKNLTSVTVYIANSNNVPAEESIQVPITSNSMNVNCSYVINDLHLPSGQYYMIITASNGTNSASAFQQIYIYAVPEKRIAVYAITHNASGVHAWGIDSVFKVSPAFSYTVPGDYSSSDINLYYQQLYIAGYDSGNVNVYSVPQPAANWNIMGYPSPVPYFTNVYCNNDVEFVSYYGNNMPNGYVKSYNHEGAIQAVYNADPAEYPIKTFLWGSYLFMEEKSISSSSEYLKLLYEGSTAAYNYTSITGPVVAMYGYDKNDIFLFGNNTSGGGYIKLYNILNSTFYSPPFSLSSYGNLLSVAQINANTYLLGFSNGAIYQYSYNPVSFVSYINSNRASTIRYDSINNQVITASGNVVSEYNYGVGGASLVTSVTIPDSVRDVRILYNK